MSYKYLLVLLGAVLVVLALAKGGWFLIALWFACNVLILGVAYARGSHRVFGKRSDGTLPFWSWAIFLPLLLYASAIWYLLRLSREPAQTAVTEHLVIGRRLLGREFHGEFDNVVDLTAEFPEPLAIRSLESYRSFPILDGAAPAPEALWAAVANLRPGRTFVHCAQGHGRAALFALAFLLRTRVAHDVEDGLRKLSTVRPGVRLSREQRNCIENFARLID